MTAPLIRALAAIGTTALLVSTASAQQHHRTPPNQVHVGVAVVPFQIEGLVDAHISDWELYGLKSQNSTSEEARVLLPLDEGNTDELGLLPGVRLGWVYDLAGPLTAVAEAGVHIGGAMTVVTAQIGADMFLVDGKNFKIGIPIRVGGIYATMDFGDLEVIEGYTPPVILNGPDGEEQRFNNGDTLKAELSGPMVSAGLAAEAWLTPQLGLRAEAGFSMGFFGDMKIRSGDQDIPIESNAIVKPDGSSDSAGLAPEGGSVGLSGFAGIVYRL
tara:strand:+ start:120 stop:935 length:816 start_codon:yes stop_codon:yes gene_type:complete